MDKISVLGLLLGVVAIVGGQLLEGGSVGSLSQPTALLIVLGGLLGMALAGAIVPIVSAASGGIINLPGIPGETWLVGLVLMVAIGLVIGTLPALRAMRLKIVDALAGR